MSQGLIYMVGPSGVGKDSLLAWLSRQSPEALRVPIHIARRSITRLQDGGTECHEPLTEAEFSKLVLGNGFAMQWEANGLRYGIRETEFAPLQRAQWVLVNGSRAYVPELRRDWPGAAVLHVQAPADVVRERLLGRGREKGAELEARVQRSQDLGAAHVLPGDMTLVNAGSLDVSGRELIALLAARAQVAVP